MAIYDLSNISTNATGNFLELARWANYASDGLLFPLFLIGGWFVLFSAMQFFDSKHAFVSATYTTAIMGVLFRAADLVSDPVAFGCIAALGIATVVLIYSNNE
jgi:hypothetical protein